MCTYYMNLTVRNWTTTETT